MTENPCAARLFGVRVAVIHTLTHANLPLTLNPRFRALTVLVGQIVPFQRQQVVLDTLWPATWGANNGYVDRVPEYGDLHQYTSAFPSKAADYGCPGGRDMNRLTGRKPLSFFTGRVHDGTGYVGLVQATGKVYLRQGPGENYKVIATVPKGKYATRRDGDVAGWRAVSYRGAEGYVSERYAKIVQEK